MTIDATFWVMISFFIFIGLLIYFQIPQKIKQILDVKRQMFINYNDDEKEKIFKKIILKND